jgi:hypothetical protein
MVYPPPPPPPPPISIAEMNVPPPPPMSTMSGFHPRLISKGPRSAVLDKLDAEQQSLRDLRDKLVGARFSVAAKRQELRDLHIETSAKDGHVFNLLRQYLNEVDADLPRDIEDALIDASSLRDRLGLLEAGYDEAEAGYNASEWKYSRRETRFVEELLNNRLVPSETLDRSRSADNLEMLHLTNSMTGATNIDSIISDLTAFGYGTGTSPDMQLSEFAAEHALIFPHRSSVKYNAPRFKRSNMTDATLVSTSLANDFHHTHSHLRWVEKMNTIDEWLFGIVETSRLQKASLKATHDFGIADTETWWEHTKWLLVQDYSTYFHTGDSTVSNYTADESASKHTKEFVSSTSSLLEPCTSSQVLLGIQPSGVSDTAAFPSFVRSDGYHETNDQRQTSRELSTGHRKGVTSLLWSKPNSWNAAPAAPQISGTIQRRHTVPDIKEAEPEEVTVPAFNPKAPSFTPRNFPPPVVYPDSRKLDRRHSSQSSNQLRQNSDSIRPFLVATPHVASPKTNQTSPMKSCLFM